MAKPYVHAESSVKHFKVGKPEDYLDIHTFMDSTKASYPNIKNRMFTHNSWFIKEVLPRVFGQYRMVDGVKISIEAIGEQHVLEDFRGSIPTPQDWCNALAFESWMNNGLTKPASSRNNVVSTTETYKNEECPSE